MDVPESSTVPCECSSVAGTAPGQLLIEWVYPSGLPIRTGLTGARTTLGRGSDCDVVLDRASVSRKHLDLGRQGPIITFKDLRSTNGTFLNGQPLGHSALAPGDVLRVGDCIGVVWQPPSLAPPAEFADIVLECPELAPTAF